MRARKFDVEKAFIMYSDFIKWRRDNDVDQIEVELIIK
jgi:hypothetical protein